MITTLGCASMLALTLGAAPASPTPAQEVGASSKAPAKQAKTTKKAEAVPIAKPMATKKKADGVTKDAAALLEKVQSFYAKIEDWRADFIQRHTKVALSRTTENRGVLMLKKPSYMRWAYTHPEEKLWIVDGDTLYVVEPEFEQVFIDEHFKTEELQSSISFLWGKGKLDESFTAKVGDPKAHGAKAGAAVLELTPKKGASYRKLVLIIDAKTGEVAESIIHETAGNTNHFIFKNPQKNTKMDAKLFQYTPPEHYEVVTP